MSVQLLTIYKATGDMTDVHLVTEASFWTHFYGMQQQRKQRRKHCQCKVLLVYLLFFMLSNVQVKSMSSRG